MIQENFQKYFIKRKLSNTKLHLGTIIKHLFKYHDTMSFNSRNPFLKILCSYFQKNSKSQSCELEAFKLTDTSVWKPLSQRRITMILYRSITKILNLYLQELKAKFNFRNTPFVRYFCESYTLMTLDTIVRSRNPFRRILNPYFPKTSNIHSLEKQESAKSRSNFRDTHLSWDFSLKITRYSIQNQYYTVLYKKC